jgi:hypothetical protein
MNRSCTFFHFYSSFFHFFLGRCIRRGTSRDHSKNETELDTVFGLFIVLVSFGVACVIFVLCAVYCVCPDENSRNAIRSNNPAIHNRYDIQTSAESNGRPVYSQLQWQNTHNFRERHFETQNLIRDIPLTNSIGSIEQQLSANSNPNLRRTSVEQHTSSLPPAYDDIVRHNSVTITTEQQSLLPPSYDEFIRQSNERQ